MARRIAAVVLPRLPSELARLARPSIGDGPLAVVLTDEEESETSGAALVGAVDDTAARLGVKVGERVSEAMARSSELRFTSLSPRAIDEALALVAEVALGFGPVVEISSCDTIAIDITGADHLFAGEAAMRDEIAARVASLGFRVDVAISDGPFLAQALARYAGIHPDLPRIAPPDEARKSLARLPVAALGLDQQKGGPDSIAFFGRLGVLSLGDMMRIDRAQLAARLTAFTGTGHVDSTSGRNSRPPLGEVLGWLDGIDARPLVPYEPPAILGEQLTFEDGVESAPQLVFAVRGLVARLSSRLVGRRQATNRVDVSIRYDRSILLLRRDVAPSASADLSIDLPAPLSHTDDLFRAVKAKVESLELAAPAVAIEIRLSRIARAPEVQLDLSRDVSVSPDALPALLSELSAEIGVDQVGVLVTIDDHRPEKRSLLSSPTEPPPTRERKKSPQLPLFDSADSGPPEPPRLLPRPIPLGTSADGGRRLSALRPGTTVFIGKVAFTIRHVRFDRRIDGVAWWTKGVVHRDYLRVTLAEEAKAPSPSGQRRGSLFADAAVRSAAEAWVFVDRRTGETFLHGWWE